MIHARTYSVLSGLLACLSASAIAAPAGHDGLQLKRLQQAQPPHQRQILPPTVEQSRYQLPPTNKPRYDLLPRDGQRMQAMAATPACKNMDTLASYSGAALADYVARLPDYECTYPLFGLTASQAARVYSNANMNAVVARFSAEAGSYNASTGAVANLALYLRAGYYLASGSVIPALPAAHTTALRAPIWRLVEGSALYRPNPVASTTAGETIRLITNMHDEAYYLPSMKRLVTRFTNTATRPSAADALKDSSAAGGFTSALTVIFYAHSRPDGKAVLASDASYPAALHNFVTRNKAALLASTVSYQLTDAANEAYRFMQHAQLKPAVRPMIEATLASSSMTGADSGLWLAAASAVKYYDNANCASYGTCDYASRLANVVLKVSHTCSPSLRIRAQDMTLAQLQESCATLAKGDSYFHEMLQTNRVPVANDRNTTLELVVFDDFANYAKYASVIYDIDTNNGGMYLEGDPSAAGNQARFIAHEASWLRPVFKVWNLEHEYVHYLDGRFNLAGDFGASVAKPTVWWIEGIGEYLSLKNDNQASIDVARRGTYKLSQIFGNTYSMADYTDRAYRWGYMATRFMNERHRRDVDSVLARFRVGDYDGYQNYMNYIGTRYDNEFAAWVQSATTAGTPPLPVVTLPACTSTSQLGRNCSINNFASSSQSYAYIMLPPGAKNLRLFTSGGTGNVDLYVGLDRYPSTASYTAASRNAGNGESVSIPAPASGRWYYIMLKGEPGFSGVSLSATYD
ncbi:M9 family metallopeptidase [Massilia sp. PAMC28688]|uniref:M9 family metallopeptidase n=1 Tax=Massilia sp. PAMC28688 TaxID=2861283 RepID=UPI001C62611C|nr:M9 family metallopeptidase [Massilia sp. PAMC28688]QYF95164.1 M9 family metallopeptidase [Massilia sp. PAMC28688]